MPIPGKKSGLFHYRCHVVEQFNCGVYNIVIATDEVVVSQDSPTARKSKLVILAPSYCHAASYIFVRKRKRDKEYGVSRGIDFQHVDNVVLFDFPTSFKAYIHCIGR